MAILKILECCGIAGEIFEPGQLVDVPDASTCRALAAYGKAREASESEIDAAQQPKGKAKK